MTTRNHSENVPITHINAEINELVTIMTALISEVLKTNPESLLAAETVRYMIEHQYWHCLPQSKS